MKYTSTAGTMNYRIIQHFEESDETVENIPYMFMQIWSVIEQVVRGFTGTAFIAGVIVMALAFCPQPFVCLTFFVYMQICMCRRLPGISA